MADRVYTETLTPRYSRIMDLAMKGLSVREIASIVDMRRGTVATIVNAANFQHQLAVRRASYEEKHDESILRFEEETISAEKEAQEELRKNALSAAQKMVDLLEDESSAIQLKSAADILDRVGPSKQSGASGAQQAVIINISEKDAAVIQETLRE